MSEIRNGRLGLYGAKSKHLKCNRIVTLGFEGLISSDHFGVQPVMDPDNQPKQHNQG